MFSGTSIVYPAGAAAAEAASTGDQALQALQAVITEPLPDRSKNTPSKRKMSPHGMMIVICDEMDQLMSSAQEVLYDLFFMPQVICIQHHLLCSFQNMLTLLSRELKSIYLLCNTLCCDKFQFVPLFIFPHPLPTSWSQPLPPHPPHPYVVV